MTPHWQATQLMAGLRDGVGRWWDGATDAQRADARAILDPDSDVRRHWLGRSKGYSKTRDVAGASIAALLTQFPAGASGYVAASDGDQAGLVRQSIAGFVDGTAGLGDQLRVDQRRVTSRSGAELVILAADSAGSHGLRPFWLVVDELCNWPDVERHRSFFDSLWAGLPKVAGSRGIVITTAGSPGHFSRAVYEAACSEGGLWRVSDLHGPAPWVDRGELEAERRRLASSVFARWWLNEWSAAEDSVADPVDVDRCMTLDGPLAPAADRTYVICLDLGTRHDRTAAAVCHGEATEGGTRVVVDRLQLWVPRPGCPVSLDEVRLWLAEFSRSYRGAVVLYDPSQAYLLVEQLRQGGVVCREFTFTAQSVGRLAGALVSALRSATIVLPRDEVLRDELLTVRLREGSTPGQLRLDHAAGRHDDQAVVLGMAVVELVERGRPVRRARMVGSHRLRALRQAQEAAG